MRLLLPCSRSIRFATVYHRQAHPRSLIRLLSSQRHEPIDPTHKQYAPTNAEWTVLALDHPLIHEQTGIKVHLVGIHHNSPASLERVEQVIEEIKPAAVCLEIDAGRLRSYSAKAEVILGRLRREQKEQTTPLSIQERPSRAPPRLQGVQTVLSPASSQSMSPAFSSLTDDDRETLSRLGIDPALHFSPTHLHYGLEIGVAIRSAQQHDAVIRSIDIHPDVLRTDPSHSTLVKDLVKRYHLLPPPSRSTSILGRALFWLITRWAFGITRDVAKETEADISSVQDHAVYLRCWKTFHPTAYFWWLEIRNAGMVDGIRSCVRDVAESSGLLSGSADHMQKDPPSVVVVVGKSHIFGIAEMWADVMQKEEFSLVSIGEARTLTGDSVPYIDDAIAEAIKGEEDAMAAAEAIRTGRMDSGEGAVRIIVHGQEKDELSGVRPSISEDQLGQATRKRRSDVPPPQLPPCRSPSKQPTGIRYVD